MTESPPSPPQPTVELANISLLQIEFGHRFRGDLGDLKSLIEDFKEKGVIQPIAVMRQDNNTRPYKLIAGGRRMSAALQCGLVDIPCRIYPSDLSDLDYREIELMENVSRKELSWQERVMLTEEIDRLKKERYGESHGSEEGHSASDTAKLLGVSHMTVSREKKLAEGIKRYGDKLTTAKNQSEALRLVKRLERQDQDTKVLVKYKSDVESNVDQVKMVLGNSYKHDDFFQGAEYMPSEAYHFVEIDPPYGINLKNIKRGADTGTIENYNEIAEEMYPDFLTKLMETVERLMFPYSWVACWCGFQWMETVMSCMREVGLEVCPIPGAWIKGTVGQTNQPETRLGSAYEIFVYARKGQAILRQQGRTNTFHYPPVTPDTKIHPTERPIELMVEIIKTFKAPEGRVLTPFAGSGNTLLAASNLGSSGTGFDLSEEYRNSFVGRVDGGTPGKYTSVGLQTNANNGS
tara:strand:- start:396 stop:1784 length:1389 start_codon:yes stop_codon:yes gene_type:complete